METEKIRKIFLFLISISCLLFIIQAAGAGAATLYLSPSSGTYTTGNAFLIEIKVNSGGMPINAADGTLIFNPNNLEVINVSKISSIFSLWVQEPAFSNSLGTINFAGGKPSPGFIGAAGTIANITFRAKTAGTANVTFASGSVLADDGRGTNILTNMGAGNYIISGRTITPIPLDEPSVPGVPGLPIVFSLTHPDENKWYSNNNPEFSWELPEGITDVSFLLHENPTGDPGSESDGLLTSTKFENIEDGVWYFHIKFKNQYGWGQILHRKVLIDTTPPLPFEIVIDNEDDETNPVPKFIFETSDTPAGLEYYEIFLNGKSYEIVPAEDIKNNFYRPSPLPPGNYSATIKAFDKAGNYSSASAAFDVLPFGYIKITKVPSRIRMGDVLKVEGETLPEITARIYIQKQGEEPILAKTIADSQGKFVLQYEEVLLQGDYFVWAQAEDERGALSEPTKKYALKVGLPPFLQFGKIILDYLTIMITLIVLIIGVLVVIFYSWYRITVWRRRIRKETKEVSQSVNSAFRALREEVEEQVAMLDKKPGLTKKEKEIRDKLQEALDVSERFIGKEIKDVERELE